MQKIQTPCYPVSSLQVRVPTHEDGTCLFWEFATDNYDIGFGVYFEWTKDTSNVVSVHISESEEEEEEEEPEGSYCILFYILFNIYI